LSSSAVGSLDAWFFLIKSVCVVSVFPEKEPPLASRMIFTLGSWLVDESLQETKFNKRAVQSDSAKARVNCVNKLFVIVMGHSVLVIK